jgi:predicted HTH transcriptional regulator
MLKTVAAFASGTDGGTVLVGVDNDTRVIGVDSTKLDELQLRLRQMIRDTIDPEPTV